MATAAHYSAKGEQLGEVELPGRIFDQPVHEHAIWEAVRAYLANQRLGTAKVKTRAEVSGGGRKPWRQKGTGRARRGTIRAPLHVGGGRAFGPRPRDYGYQVPKKVKSLALRSALSARARDNQIFVIDPIELEAPRTREVASLLGAIGVVGKKCLLVLGDHSVVTYRSSRNIKHLKTMTINDLNTYAVMQSEALVIDKSGLDKIEEVLRV